jgi:hypothetical protein
VSARHGLVDLTQLLSPYDRKLDQYTEEEREAWAAFVVACLRLEDIGPHAKVFIHASQQYARYLSAALQGAGFTVKTFDLDAELHPEDLDPT